MSDELRATFVDATDMESLFIDKVLAGVYADPSSVKLSVGPLKDMCGLPRSITARIIDGARLEWEPTDSQPPDETVRTESIIKIARAFNVPYDTMVQWPLAPIPRWMTHDTRSYKQRARGGRK